jgi:hypothetical protein
MTSRHAHFDQYSTDKRAWMASSTKKARGQCGVHEPSYQYRSRKGALSGEVRSTHNPFRVIATSIFSKFCDGNQNTSPNPPYWQPFRGDKVVQPALADGKKLRGFLTAHQYLVLGRDGHPLGWLSTTWFEDKLVRFLCGRQQSASGEFNDIFSCHSPFPFDVLTAHY